MHAAFGTWHRTWDHCSSAKTCCYGGALSPEIVRYMVCVSRKMDKAVAALLVLELFGRVGDHVVGAGGARDCWVSCAGGDLPLPLTNCEKTLEIASKPLQAMLGLEEVAGTRFPCLAKQRVEAGAGAERLLSFPTWRKLYFVFCITVISCCDGCKKVPVAVPTPPC